ncbi:MAG: YlbF family regulator [Thermanaerothrix sp.]|nr:YlbF family regulator [Thermanaerothrix sp.]
MMLSPELTAAAQALGESLRRHPMVQAYHEAVVRCEADPEAVDLEARLHALYTDLVRRQERGEVLTRAEVQFFNNLKQQVYQHPCIRAREDALAALKPYLASIADELTQRLGVDYPAVVLAAGDEN